MLETQLQAIVAEASSADPWTSRARPNFLYVMYILLLTALPMGVLSAFHPMAARDIAAGTLTAFSRRLLPSGRVYRLCYRKSRAHEAQLVALHDWLLSGMAEAPAGRRKRRRPAEIQNMARP